MTDITSRFLPEGTLLSGRYLLGAVRKISDAGIAYTAFDRKLRIPAEVYEYYPIDCAMRHPGGSIAAKPGCETIYRDKCRRLLTKGNLCLHQPESDVYDVLSINGTLYFIHAVSSDKAADFYAYGAEDAITPPAADATPPEDSADDEKTRTVHGLFLHDDIAAESSDPAADNAPTAPFPAEAFRSNGEDVTPIPKQPAEIETTFRPEEERTAFVQRDKPSPQNNAEDTIAIPMTEITAHDQKTAPECNLSKKPKQDKAAAYPVRAKTAERIPLPAGTDPETTGMDLSAEEPAGTNLKLLMAILIGGVLLLVLCCTIFLLSLSRITGGGSPSASVIGVPLSEAGDVTGQNIRIISRTVDPAYAAGMIVAESVSGSTLDVTVNGEIPTYAVPDFIGMTASGAQSLFSRTRFQNSTGYVTGNLHISYIDTAEFPDGMIIEQSPEAGTERNTADVSVIVARNPAKNNVSSPIPSLVGKVYQAYTDGFACLITDRVYSDTAPAGAIVSQYPSPGEELAGGVLYVVVSLGKEQTAVPDVTYMTLSEAENALYEKGLSFTVRYALHNGVAENLVAAQEPAAGSTAAYGDTVTLSVSGDGTWNTEIIFQTTDSCFILQPGEQVLPEWQGLSGGNTPIFHSSDPHTVAISDSGEVIALHSGHAVVTASYGGSTTPMFFTVEYQGEAVAETKVSCDEKLSLSGLTELAGCTWTIRAGDASIDGDTLTGNAEGLCIVSGETGNEAVLLQIRLAKAEKDKTHVKIAKKSISTEAETKKLLSDTGLTCTVESEYSQTFAKGKVVKIRYTGYSDTDHYYFTEGSKVTLIISLGKPEVTSIRITQKPAKLTYSVGDKLNLSGMVITATYTDGTEQAISSGYTTEYDFSKAGRQTVSVAFEGRKASFAVEVVDTTAQKAAIKTLPTKTTYAPGDTLDMTGLSVEVTYGNGTKKVFHSGFTVKADLTKVGNATVQVTVEGVSTQFTVTVAEKKVRTLDLIRLPDKTDYTVGDTLDTSGMQLRANYTDGTTATITSGWSASCDLTKAGASTVTVTFGKKNVTFAVTVHERAKETETEVVLSALSVLTMPEKSVYAIGEKFDPNGLVLLAKYSDGSSKKLTDGFTASYDFRTIGRQTVLFQFGGMSTEITVDVRESEKNIRLSAEKLEVEVGNSVELKIALTASHESVSYTVDGSVCLQIEQVADGLRITGAAPGKAVLTFTCGADTAVCTVTVTGSNTTSVQNVTYSTPITNETSISFMPMLVFDNTGTTDATFTFTARIAFDPNAVSCADAGTSHTDIRVSYDGQDTVTVTGTITIPAGGSVTAAYVLFLGTDQNAFAVTVS